MPKGLLCSLSVTTTRIGSLLRLEFLLSSLLLLICVLVL